MGEAQRIEALWEDILDYEIGKALAENMRQQSAADVYQELADEARRHIAIILNDGMVPA